MCYQVDISNQINETNCFLNQYLLPTNKDFFLLFFWINILPSSLLSAYYLLPLACFDMWFRTKCFSMKKIDYAKKTHLSFFFVCLQSWDTLTPRTPQNEKVSVPVAAQVEGGQRWSTCVLVCFSWLLDHMIYLKLRKK